MKLKIGAGMIVAVCATCTAFVLHAILWYNIALPIEPEVYPNHAIYFGEQFIYYDVYALWHGLPLYVGTTIGMAFTAAIWSVIALAVSIWIPDKLLVVAIHVCGRLCGQRGRILHGMQKEVPACLRIKGRCTGCAPRSMGISASGRIRCAPS